MSQSVILHLKDGEPVLGEVDELPEPTHETITLNNPRRVDGKDLHYLAVGVVQVIWPIGVINFIEIMPSEEADQIIGFVRE